MAWLVTSCRFANRQAVAAGQGATGATAQHRCVTWYAQPIQSIVFIYGEIYKDFQLCRRSTHPGILLEQLMKGINLML